MANTSFVQMKHQIDRLTPLDQVKLLEYISIQIEKVITSIPARANIQERMNNDAWLDFFKIGEELRKSNLPESDTLTSTLLSMRR